MNIRTTVGTNVAKLRRDRQLSQEQLALRAQLTRAYLSGIEAGRRNPTIEVLARLATVLNVRIEVLVKEAPSPSSVSDSK